MIVDRVGLAPRCRRLESGDARVAALISPSGTTRTAPRVDAPREEPPDPVRAKCGHVCVWAWRGLSKDALTVDAGRDVASLGGDCCHFRRRGGRFRFVISFCYFVV